MLIWKKLREEISTLTDLKSKLREDKTYAEASKNMLQDTSKQNNQAISSYHE